MMAAKYVNPTAVALLPRATIPPLGALRANIDDVAPYNITPTDVILDLLPI
jgi:hypothetical protein